MEVWRCWSRGAWQEGRVKGPRPGAAGIRKVGGLSDQLVLLTSVPLITPRSQVFTSHME